jgi:hypothetical protein
MVRRGLVAGFSMSFALAAVLGCGGGDETTSHSDAGDGGAGLDATTDARGGSDGARPDGASPPGDGGTGADAWTALPPTPAAPELWYWHQSYLSPTSTTEPMHSEQLIDQAVAAGYTGLAFWDSALTFANRPGWDNKNLAAVVSYATSKGLKVLAGGAPVGYSNDMLQTNPNLAEGTAIKGGQFKVSGGKLEAVNSLAPLANPGFESGKADWFGTGDARTSVDTTVAHTGAASGIIEGNASATDNARFTQALTLTPSRLYHIQLWFKTSGFSGNTLNVEVLDFTTDKTVTLTRMAESPTLTGTTQDWTVFDYAFNSQESTAVTLYIGVWGGFAGTVWIDDVVAEETSLVNVLRRSGTPLKAYDSTTTYKEGIDYANVVDPALAASPGTYDPWHTPPVVTVPAGSQLEDGATVAMDYYTVVPQIGWEVSSCLSDPAIQSWNAANAKSQVSVFPKRTGVFLGYDEMRQGDSCEECRAKGLTAGELLAWNTQETVKTLNGIWGAGTPYYFWDDMFSPYHNAVDDYYDVEGDLTGSWLGLPPGAVIMNWNLGNLTKSLTFFSGTDTSVSPAQPHGMQQIIAGYYDSGDGASAAMQEMQAAMGIHGVVGLMYTSWEGDYTQLGAYATAAKAAWPAYMASTP